MGLFFNKVKHDHPTFEFNKDVLNNHLFQLRREIYADRNSESHKNLVQFMEDLRNIEILNLATEKDLSSDSHSYHRGRIDSLNTLLSMRLQIIDEVTREKASASKKSTKDARKGSYIRPLRDQAGLAN